jgi:hypothetical protein
MAFYMVYMVSFFMNQLQHYIVGGNLSQKNLRSHAGAWERGDSDFYIFMVRGYMMAKLTGSYTRRSNFPETMEYWSMSSVRKASETQ